MDNEIKQDLITRINQAKQRIQSQAGYRERANLGGITQQEINYHKDINDKFNEQKKTAG